jgi:hypothetical protein
VLVKWLWVSVFKMIVHPAMLPITLATFISVAGPGGFAEIGQRVSAVPTVTVTPDSPPAITNPPAFLVRVVHEEATTVAAPTIEPDLPSALDIADESLGAVDEAPDTPDEALMTIEVPASTTQPDEPDNGPVVVPSTAEEPADTPSDGDTVDDGAGDVGNDGDPTEDDDTGSGDPSEDNDDVGEDNPGDGDAGNGSDGADEADCDPPGTGPDPHGGVPPGHDQNGDGIDDRCQEDESEGQGGGGEGTDGGASDDPPGDEGASDEPISDNGDEGASDEPIIDGGASDDVPGESNADRAECDPPGNGHDNHGTPPPGHDKNEDGIDDRCQDFAGNTSSADQGSDRKKNDDG